MSSSGSVRRRGDAWRVTVDAGRDLSGRRRQLTGTARTKAEALELRNRLLIQAGNGAIATPTTTVGDLWTAYMAAAGPPTKVARDDYTAYWKRYLEPALARIKLTKLGALELDLLYAQLRDDKQLAPATIRKAHTVISAALSYAVRIGWLASNPARRASPPAVGRTQVEAAPVEELRKLLEAQRGTLLGLYVLVIATLGVRRGEALGLQWGDVDFERGQVMVRRRVTRTRDVVDFTKNNTARVLAAPPQLLVELEARRSGHRLEAFIFTRDADGARPWWPDDASRQVREAAIAAEANGVRSHKIRHHAATTMLTAGVDVRTAAGRLGHDPAVMLRTYGHFVRAADRAAAEALERALEG